MKKAKRDEKKTAKDIKRTRRGKKRFAEDNK